MKWLLVVLAACSGSSTAIPDADLLPSHVADPVIHGAHGSTIDIVAATDDGAAAVSQDAEGNTRLWPTLDGTAEPIVVHATAAEELALVRGADGFMIAMLDTSGDLQLVRIAPSGITRSHASLGDLAVHQIAVTASYVLALRDDQTIAVIDATGHEHGRIAMAAGARAIAIVTRNDHAIAIARYGKDQIIARPFDPSALTWRSAYPPIANVSGARFALTPDGTRLAYETSSGAKIVILASGVTSKVGDDGMPIGFLDDQTLACQTRDSIRWFTPGTPDAVYMHTEPHPELAAYGGKVQITGEGVMLGIAAVHAKTMYLGYQLSEPSIIRSSPLGLTISRGSRPVLLDHALHVQRELAIDTTVYGDALPIDDRYLLRTQSGAGALQVMLVDTQIGKPVSIGETTDVQIHFEAATNLLGIHNNDRSSLIPYDPTTHHFGQAIPLAGISHRIVLTDPSRADGVVAVSTQILGGISNSVRVTEYTRGGETTHSYVVSGDVMAIDRAARTYVASGDRLHVYIAGGFDAPVSVCTFEIAGTPIVVPNDDATHLLVINNAQLALADLDGHTRWSLPTQAIDAGWIGNEPFARFTSGLAKLDARDGHLLERVCGWNFGLYPQPVVGAGYAHSVCDAE